MFQTHQQMLETEPNRLAAECLLRTFRLRPLVDFHQLFEVVDGMCVQKAPRFLGLVTSEQPVLMAVITRTILIWERALAASRYVVGGDSARSKLVLIDYRCMTMRPIELTNHFKLS
ncbi:hypothetical protein [Granulicoccus phenolivorans]|uniref:hypothetical protein n=1 Tax=Granulicoccus phenolivorans TaxID=266854 RepID=UPI0004100AAB|nr:hypothetical protein [Granulicoccus phenolivorans]